VVPLGRPAATTGLAFSGSGPFLAARGTTPVDGSSLRLPNSAGHPYG
jgi:hypothetical protein